jgi:hypothetical protein
MSIASAATALLSGLLLAITPASGQTWTQTSANTNYEWDSIACSADGTKLVAAADVSGSEEIFLSTNSGDTWALSGGPTDAGFLVSSADGTKLAATSEDLVFTSTNSGGTWTQNRPPSEWQGSFGSLAMSADGKTLVVLTDQSSSGGIYVSTNAGSSWILATNLNTFWENAACPANGTKLAALTSSLENSVYISTNSGATWQSSLSFETPEPGESWLYSTSDGSLLVAEAVEQADDKFFLSTNWGQTWSRGILKMWCTVGSANGSMLVGILPGHSGSIYTSTNLEAPAISNSAPQAVWNALACSADGRKLFASAGSNDSPSTNGIWTLQLPAAPQINFSSSTGAINFSWLVPSTNMLLEESPDMNLWTALTNSPSLNLTNLQEQLSLLATNSSEFFRLVSQ